ncbi:MAG: hypothetical protein KA191_04000 [Verrucomicrobia bacterium]|jgi:hypothetical protein|nr:hypothetical protein [Verrucomicrobiota bacterium]OQC67401.1 MAG: hypothetical protein BWX48_00766 [Verrucomicrobia bacterium ADurb.Bin006]MDI9380185.1 hypothetical protein [Verrucomicrobiota bacterium]NMD19634.1 hypothetical protein [Verrucomicrobiota bacterium]HNU99180.1 hypothetical protein [Verrucomicrobiota bacterium]
MIRIALSGVSMAWLLISASAQTLYDGALRSLPVEQDWTFLAFPGGAVQALADDAVCLDTWSSALEQAGYGRTTPIALDRSAGVTVLFAARVDQESHGGPDRAGFSVIALGCDQRGIELGFWTNVVFAQSDLPLFTHAEDALFDTRTAFVDYALTLRRDRYQLRANGKTILEGPARDYTAFSGTIDPYETPDFVFLGDDTTSARAVVWIRRVVLVPAPILRVSADGTVTWAGVAGVPYTIETSADLAVWTRLASVTSTTGLCTHAVAPGTNARFLRVAGP